MKKIFLTVITVFLLSSCIMGFDSDMGYIYPVNVSSPNIFSINGHLYTQTRQTPYFKIYNPNNYAIQVTVGENVYDIEPYCFIEIEEPDNIWD